MVEPHTSAASGPGGRTGDRGPASAEQAKAKAEAKAEEAKQQAEEKAEEAKAQAREVASDVKQKAEEEVDRRTSQGADRLDTVVRALHSAADQLDADGQEWLADYTRKAAGQVDRVTGYLRDEDAPGMLNDLEHMARSNPGTFLGTTFAAGLAAGRFLRSSQPGAAEGDGSEYRGSPAQRTSPDRADSRTGTPTGRFTAGAADDVSASPRSDLRSGGAGLAGRAAGGARPGGRARGQNEGRS